MKTVHILLFLFATCQLFAQTEYKAGRYTTKQDEVKHGFILDLDWRNNPEYFDFKSSMEGEAIRVDRAKVKSFTLNNVSKYINAYVKIDRRDDEVAHLNTERNPTFEEEHVFLKVLVEGEADLYKYQSGNFICYYYLAPGATIKPLIYKRYLTDSRAIKVNNQFRQQLSNNVSCDAKLNKEISRLEYKESPLVNYFLSYNSCVGGEAVDLSRKKREDFFHVRLKPGITHASLLLSNGNFGSSDIDFGAKTTFRMGLEAEFILPFNNDKWSVVIEPTYQYFKSDIVKSAINRDVITDYKAIELPIGARYYMFLNENSRLFLNALYSFNFAMNSYVGTLPLRTRSPRDDISVGVGYQIKKFSAEFRYTRKGNLTGDYIFRRGEYKKIAFVFGYQLK